MDPILLWWLSLAIFVVVVAVVALLLLLVVRTARSIDDRAAGIWQAGKEIAANTVAIWILGKASQQLGQVQEATERLEEKVGALGGQVSGGAGSRGRGS